MASATATPTAPTAAISASVAVTATAKILAGTIVATTGGIVLRGIVMGRKVLRRGSVGLGLALLGCFGVLVIQGSGLNFVAMPFEMVFTFGSVRFLLGIVLLLHVVRFFLMKLFVVRFLMMFSGTGQ
jgi:hypothetical protein